jgi:hypothetical protein
MQHNPAGHAKVTLPLHKIDAPVEMQGRVIDAIYEMFPKGEDIDKVLTGPQNTGKPTIKVNPDGSVSTSGGVPQM